MKENVVLSKSEVALVINNLTMLKQVDGTFQGGSAMDKLYVDLNKAYDRMNDPIHRRLNAAAKDMLRNTEYGYKNYDEAYVAAKELLIEDIKWEY
jgi:hypothetical protein